MDLHTIQQERENREDKQRRSVKISSVLEEIEQAMEEMEDFGMIDSTIDIETPINSDEEAFAYLYRAWLLLSNQL